MWIFFSLWFSVSRTVDYRDTRICGEILWNRQNELTGIITKSLFICYSLSYFHLSIMRLEWAETIAKLISFSFMIAQFYFVKAEEG